MTKLSKIIYWGMLILCTVSIASSIVTTDYTRVMTEIATLCWVGVAWMHERRAIKLQKKLDELHGNN